MAARNTLTVLALTALLGLAGCGAEDEDKDPSATPPPSGAVTDNRVTGSVGDGPIVGARLRVLANTGELIMETESSATADYDVTIKTRGRNYAVTIEADQGIDLVTGGPPDFTLATSIARPNSRTISNLNPFTTLIVRTAQRKGGLSETNVTAVRDALLERYSFGLDTLLVPDPAETAIDGDNVHLIVKTSEALGEMIRRTRDALNVTGANTDGNRVVAALAADLTDGWIDGKGASGRDARIAAVANVATAAVMVQFLANRLHVEGVDATLAMDNAIRQVRPDAPETSTTANVAITAAALERTIKALEAAALLVDDERIGWTIDVLADTAAGSLSADLAPRLPAGIDKVLNDAVSRSALASNDKLTQINQAARSSTASGGGNESEPPPEPVPPPPTEPPPEPAPPPGETTPNTPPTISGTPNAKAHVNVAWSFQPSAQDADGDKLTFSVMNKPAWLNFDPATGRLWGTPSAANIGTHMQIRVSVSDGTASASLPAFDLTVATPDGTATVSWAAPTEREDGSALSGVSQYKIYYGTSRSNLNQVATVSGTTTSYKVEGLHAGTWYFAVTATCGGGLESAKSTIGSKTIL